MCEIALRKVPLSSHHSQDSCTLAGGGEGKPPFSGRLSTTSAVRASLPPPKNSLERQRGSPVRALSRQLPQNASFSARPPWPPSSSPRPEAARDATSLPSLTTSLHPAQLRHSSFSLPTTLTSSTATYQHWPLSIITSLLHRQATPNHCRCIQIFA